MTYKDFQSIYPLHYDWINNFGRYFLIAGLFYFIFYFWLKNRFAKLKLQPDKRTIIRSEILYSISTMCIQCLTSILVYACVEKGYTKIYLDLADWSLTYFILSIVLMVFMHDAYFYWTHRFMHLPTIFKYFHRVHHQSVSPTPWASFSFHPLEAIVNASIIPVIIFTIPVHPFALLIFLFWLTFINVLGHLGYETVPEKFRKSRIGKLHNSTTCHDMHHRDSAYNFGLYFTIWDRLMKTHKEEK